MPSCCPHSSGSSWATKGASSSFASMIGPRSRTAHQQGEKTRVALTPLMGPPAPLSPRCGRAHYTGFCLCVPIGCGFVESCWNAAQATHTESPLRTHIRGLALRPRDQHVPSRPRCFASLRRSARYGPRGGCRGRVYHGRALQRFYCGRLLPIELAWCRPRLAGDADDFPNGLRPLHLHSRSQIARPARCLPRLTGRLVVAPRHCATAYRIPSSSGLRPFEHS